MNLWSPLAPLFQFSIKSVLLAPFSPKVNPLFYSSTCQMLDTPSSTSGGDKDTHPRIFCRKFHFEQLLIEAFFDIIGTFGSIRL